MYHLVDIKMYTVTVYIAYCCCPPAVNNVLIDDDY